MTFSFEAELAKINAALGLGGQREDVPLASDEIPTSIRKRSKWDYDAEEPDRYEPDNHTMTDEDRHNDPRHTPYNYSKRYRP